MSNKLAVNDIKDISNAEISAAIDNYVRGERDRAIMKRRLIDCITYERLAEEFNLSVRQVKNIVYRHEITVFRHI